MYATAETSLAADMQHTNLLRRVLGRSTQRRLYLLALVGGDFLMLGLAFALAYYFRFEWGAGFFNEGMVSIGHYRQLTLLIIPLWIGLFVLFRTYHGQHLLGGIEEYARVANACTIGAVLIMVFVFLTPAAVVSRGWLFTVYGFTLLCTLTLRVLLRHLVYWLRHLGYFVVPTLIVGSNEEAVSLAIQLQNWRSSGLGILGFVDEQRPQGQRVLGNLSVLGNLDTLAQVIERYHIEELIVATSALSSEQILDVFRRFGMQGQVEVRLSSGLFDVLNTSLHVNALGYVPLITINKVRLSPTELLVKNLLDRVGALLGLLLLSPLFLTLAVVIKRSSPGPILYRRRVLGQRGVTFDAFKFRTMYVNGVDLLTAEDRANLVAYHKLKDDPRITPIGSILRKYSLDELPQLWNVLRGEMSLIGPRMITAEEQEKYGKWDMNLLTVKPGLSGLWQVSGRSDVSYDERVRLDMHYIRNYSIWMDLQLLLRTVIVVIAGKGAY